MTTPPAVILAVPVPATIVHVPPAVASVNAGVVAPTHTLAAPPPIAAIKIENISTDIAAPPVQKVTPQIEIAATELKVSVFPNPAESFFSLKVQSKSLEQVTVRIIDIAGRQVQQLTGIPEQTMRFGENIVNGTYLVEVRQGSEKVMLKVIKQ